MYENNYRYIPKERERLKIPTSYVETSFFSNFNVVVGILFGPEDLLPLSKDIMEITSSLSVGVIKKTNFFHHEGSECNFFLRTLFLIEFFLQLNLSNY